jgi:hypothetical protein
MNKEDIDISKYFTITPETAFSTPVYIHSHTNSLYRAIENMEELGKLTKVLSDLLRERDRVEALVLRT